MILEALAVILLWNQPYPPAGSPPATGVRCYWSLDGGNVWGQIAEGPPDGFCGPIDVLLKQALGWIGPVQFAATGYNDGGESGYSVENARLCACEVLDEEPFLGHIGDGVCNVFVWNPCTETACTQVDRSELIDCVEAPYP